MLDRFIPPRSLQSGAPRWNGLNADEEAPEAGSQETIVEKTLHSWRRREYHRLLSDALFGVHPNERVLPLVGLTNRPGVATSGCRPWPVRPRAASVVGDPELKLGLPDYNKIDVGRCSGQLVAWGACGILAVAGRRDVYQWRDAGQGWPNGVTELLVHFDDLHPISLCWSPRRDEPLLAIGTYGVCRIQMWDCNMKRQLFSRRLPDSAPVNCISWHPFEDVIAVGTAFGMVHLVTASLILIKTQKVYNGSSLSALTFSPDGALLACGGTTGTVLVWDWNSGVVQGDETDTRSFVTSLSWHPWRSTLVAVGSLAGHITLINLSAKTVSTAQFARNSSRRVAVTALSFSPRTGELVVAFHSKDFGSQVIVLSDLTTVVDHLDEHTNFVHHLCWSPDGINLATAGADRMLCMWHFLGSKATKEVKKRALRDTREVRSGVRRQFGCIIR